MRRTSRDTNTCGRKFSGRNPTNLKPHLASFHKEQYAELEAKEKALKSERDSKAASHPRPLSSSSSSCSVKNFFTQPTTYAKDSDQHKARVRGLAKFIAESGVSTLLQTSDASLALDILSTPSSEAFVECSLLAGISPLANETERCSHLNEKCSLNLNKKFMPKKA